MFSATYAFGQIKIVAPDGDVKIGDTNTAPLSKVSITEGLTSVHIGKSSNGASNSSNLVDITGGLNGSLRIGAWDLNSNSSGGAAIQFFSDAAVAFKGQAFIDAGADPDAGVFVRTSSQTRLAVKQNGNVGIGINSPNERLHVNGNIMAAGGLVLTSDKKLKRNFTEFNRGLNEVLELNPITYEYNGKGGTIENDSHVGIFAQDLQKLAPELVKKFTYDIVEEATLEKDYKVIGQETYLAIKDSEIKYMLINAIKEQQSIIDKQNERIDKLETLLLTIVESKEPIENNNILTIDASDVQFIGQNAPNPFNGQTTIEYSIPKKSKNSLIVIFDVSGKEIKSFAPGHTGNGSLTIKANDLPAGQYSYSLIVDGKLVDTKKMILSK